MTEDTSSPPVSPTQDTIKDTSSRYTHGSTEEPEPHTKEERPSSEDMEVFESSLETCTSPFPPARPTSLTLIRGTEDAQAPPEGVETPTSPFRIRRQRRYSTSSNDSRQSDLSDRELDLVIRARNHGFQEGYQAAMKANSDRTSWRATMIGAMGLGAAVLQQGPLVVSCAQAAKTALGL